MAKGKGKKGGQGNHKRSNPPKSKRRSYRGGFQF